MFRVSVKGSGFRLQRWGFRDWRSPLRGLRYDACVGFRSRLPWFPLRPRLVSISSGMVSVSDTVCGLSSVTPFFGFRCLPPPLVCVAAAVARLASPSGEYGFSSHHPFSEGPASIQHVHHIISTQANQTPNPKAPKPRSLHSRSPLCPKTTPREQQAPGFVPAGPLGEEFEAVGCKHLLGLRNGI